MIMVSTTIRNSVRYFLAAGIAVWFSGLFFFICCSQINAGTTPRESCPRAKMAGHCNRAHKQASTSGDAVDSTSQCVDCPYLPVVFNKYSKSEDTTTELALPATRLSIKFAPPAAGSEPVQVSFSQRISYEPKLLAKNCILRI